MSEVTIYTIGFVAQILFFARMFVQWVHSEKAKSSASPVIFWQLSILGSILFMLYGVFRCDFAILFGQFLVYFIYLRNLHLKGQWKKLPWLMRLQFLVLPVVILVYQFSSAPGNWQDMLSNDLIPQWLMIWGILSQFIFTGRFFVQWFESEKREQSVLSSSFWTISLTGSLMIIVYAIFRKDPVLLAGQSFGALLYVRNLILSARAGANQLDETLVNLSESYDQK
jgi:lipid-A-disaccharide synthase-like uncharacterized protein